MSKGLSEALRTKFNVRHIIQNGARFHVTSYGLWRSRKVPFDDFCIDWCSEPFCERNIQCIETWVKNGHDPAECCYSPAVKDWLKTSAGRAVLASRLKED